MKGWCKCVCLQDSLKNNIEHENVYFKPSIIKPQRLYHRCVISLAHQAWNIKPQPLSS